MENLTSKKVIKTSLLVDLTDIALNGLVAFATGSSVMLAEALQGLADLITVIFLYIGVKRSSKRPNTKFNFGYGRELYFWVLCSSIAMFIVTAGLSFYSGLQKFMNPVPLEKTFWAYLVLAIGIISNCYALSVSYRKITNQSSKASIVKNFISSRLIEVKTAFITDLMGTLSAVFGVVALSVYAVTGDPRYDGIGAMIIAVSIAMFSIVLIIETKDMIVGKSVSISDQTAIKKIALNNDGVSKVLGLATMHFGSEELYINLNIKVDNKLDTKGIEKLIDNVEKDIIKFKPEADIIQIEIDS